MELEFHQIDLRYELLRKQNPRKERHLIASLAEHGQQLPVVVVAHPSSGHVLLDGYKRVRALKRLKQDTIRATLWKMDEAEALLLERLMRSSEAESPFEQGWLLRELQDRFGIRPEDLARSFDKTASWVSRRLALVRDLPERIQDRVRAGQIAPHTAMKVLVPLARANVQNGLDFTEAIAKACLSTREVEVLYAGWLKGNEESRKRILADPILFLRAQKAAQTPDPASKPSHVLLLDDLGVLAAVARRVLRRIRDGVIRPLSSGERQELEMSFGQAISDCEALFQRSEKELSDARPGHENRHPAA